MRIFGRFCEKKIEIKQEKREKIDKKKKNIELIIKFNDRISKKVWFFDENRWKWAKIIKIFKN